MERQVNVLNDTQSIFEDLYTNLDQCMASIVNIEAMTEETSAMTEELGQIVARSKEMAGDLKADVDQMVEGAGQFSV